VSVSQNFANLFLLLLLIGEGTDAGDYRKGSRMLGKGMPEATPDEQTDEYGRVTKGPYTLRNGATYTG